MADFPTPPLQVAIDGYAATGKSTVGLAAAIRLHILYLDTGVMYRAVALIAWRQGVSPSESLACANIAATIDLRLMPPSVNDGRQLTVCIGDEDVTWQIRSPEVSGIVSQIAQHKPVRDILIERQQRIANEQAIVMVGRDITSKVLPHAQVRVILEASLDVRVQRRLAEFGAQNRGVVIDERKVREDIVVRDRIDRHEMRAKRDAVTINTDSLTIEQVVDRIVALCQTVTDG